jgi:hypothetical protein
MPGCRNASTPRSARRPAADVLARRATADLAQVVEEALVLLPWLVLFTAALLAGVTT